MSGEVIGKCKKADCQVATDGKCQEGNELSNCPHFETGEIEINGGTLVEESSPTATEPPTTIKLFDGEDLDVQSARIITRANLSRIVVVAGMPDSGKTTLLASIYERFTDGPFCGYLFAGSRTLPAWEKRCHLSRITSGRSKPDTARDRTGGCPLLHLGVRVADLCDPIQDLLFTDVTGEVFRNICDSSEECKKLSILQRADHFVLTLDGEKLAQPDRRQDAFLGAVQGLRSCLDAEMLGCHHYVDVLFTKYDLLKPKLEELETKQFIEYVRKYIRDNFESRVARLRFFDVAARPERTKPQLEDAFGVDKCFPSWVTDAPLFCRPTTYKFPIQTFRREFDCYLWKRLPDRTV